MKAYLATRGSYDDYEILRVFAKREDAEAYPRCEFVEEHEVCEEQPEFRDLFYAHVFSDGAESVHVSATDPGCLEALDPKPGQMRVSRFDGRARVPTIGNSVVTVTGWDRERAMEQARWEYRNRKSSVYAINGREISEWTHRVIPDPFYKEEQ